MLTLRLTPTIKPLPHRRFIGNGISGGIYGRNNAMTQKYKMVQGLKVRAVMINNATSEEMNETNYDKNNKKESLLGPFIQVKAIVTIKKKFKEGLIDKVEDQLFNFKISGGEGIHLKLISEDIDPDTSSGKTVEAYVKNWPTKSSSSEHLNADDYTAEFNVPSDFGNPGAILITNYYSKEFHLVEIVLQGFQDGPLIFPAKSWIHSHNDNSESRIIFRNHTYLPSETPPGIKILRRDDLLSLRGNGKGERKIHERIYDYAPYNDLGDPDKDPDLARTNLSGSEVPYPRRCRTGRPPMKTDPESESKIPKPNKGYVPRDEAFEELKQLTADSLKLKSLFHNMVPVIASALSSSDISFGSFSEIDQLYVDDFPEKDEHHDDKNKYSLGKFTKQVLGIKDKLLKFEPPAVIRGDRSSSMRDTEFARQALAGVNPVSIELVKEFPIMSKLDPKVYGPQESAITKELLEGEMNGMTVEEAIKNKKLFTIDHHDLFLPFVNRINKLPGRKTYASRTIFFHTKTGDLHPIIIELTLPPTLTSPPVKRTYTRGTDATSQWIWKLAKAHACTAEAAVHQLLSHMLRVHASMETYIIATHRRLSQMHPIYKLLRPHMRYNMEANSRGRQSIFNATGFLDSCFTPGKYGMDISSAAYKTMWRFDKENLPADLLRRGMAVEDPAEPSGVKLVIEDYPYAADGLLIWSAIKEWVESYVAHFYPDSAAVTRDTELQEWWKDIKTEAHADMKDAPWWPKLETKEDLTGILSTIIWAGSGQHAAINFGQYPFGAHILNVPTIMRRFIPQEYESGYEEFLMNPEAFFLSSMPTPVQTAKVMALFDLTSTHSPDEEYLGQEFDLFSQWDDDQEVKHMFGRFSSRLKEIEEIIHQRNKDLKLKNRTGAGVPPYEIFISTSSPGVTGRGIPNSVTA